MTARTRKAVGGVGMMAFLAVYIWAAASLGGRIPNHSLGQVVFYGVAGIGWGLPIIPLITWMNRGR
jgi:hypothetical protein